MSTTTSSTPEAATSIRTLLRADGLSCPSCVAKIEKSVGALPGVRDVRVHFSSGRIEVDHDPATTTVDQLVGAVAAAGYTARPSVL